MFAVWIENRIICFFALRDYMEQIKQLLFNITKKERETIREKYKGKIPGTWTNQLIRQP